MNCVECGSTTRNLSLVCDAHSDGLFGEQAQSERAPDYADAPRRIQLRRTKGWRMPPNTVKVDRTTKWGNPYMVERVSGQLWETRFRPHGLRGIIHPSKNDAAKQAVDMFRAGPALHMELGPLRGKNQACWCNLCDVHKDGKPLGVECLDCSPCHADVTLELANAPPAEPVSAPYRLPPLVGDECPCPSCRSDMAEIVPCRRA